MDPDDLAAAGAPWSFGLRQLPSLSGASDPALLAQALDIYGSPDFTFGSIRSAGSTLTPNHPLSLAQALDLWPDVNKIGPAEHQSPRGQITTPVSWTPPANSPPAGTGPEGANAPPAGGTPAPSNPTIYDTWALPNGQVATEYDAQRGQNVIYHHGQLDGVAGVFVDNDTDPSHPQTVFTPTGPNAATPDHGFILSPSIGASGSPNYDKVVWEAGPNQAILRVDAQGRPVGAYVHDLGRTDDAISPTDFLGPGVFKLGAEAAAKFGPPLLKGIAAKVAAAITDRAGEAAVEEAGETPLQLGGAHRDVKGIPGYEAHHMPADSVSPLTKNEGPAIAMRPEDHQSTASWGKSGKAQSYRQRQAALLAKGDFKGAQQMDIQDIRGLFGSKYDGAIDQMLKYTDNMGY